MALLDAELLALLETASALARKRGTGGEVAGARKGILRGGNEEFADYRPYTPGDDFRRIDWKPFLRSGELLVKVFARSTSGTVHVVLDTSASMAEPERKRVFALRLAASVGYFALCCSDRLRISTLPESGGGTLGPLDGKHTVVRLLDFLEGLTFAGTANLADSIAKTASVVPGRHDLVLISDFWDDGDFCRPLSPIAERGSNITAVQVMDPDEYAPTAGGLVRLEDSETASTVLGYAGPAAVERYRELYAAKFEDLRARLAALRIPLHPARTDESIKDAVIRVATG
ncbi:MAG: DUF58 domain-containing protein [Candidatus Brocadiia bacterium]